MLQGKKCYGNKQNRIREYKKCKGMILFFKRELKVELIIRQTGKNQLIMLFFNETHLPFEILQNNFKSLEVNFPFLKIGLIIVDFNLFCSPKNQPSTFTKSLILLFQYIDPDFKYTSSFYFFSLDKFYYSFSSLLG